MLAALVVGVLVLRAALVVAVAGSVGAVGGVGAAVLEARTALVAPMSGAGSAAAVAVAGAAAAVVVALLPRPVTPSGGARSAPSRASPLLDQAAPDGGRGVLGGEHVVDIHPLAEVAPAGEGRVGAPLAGGEAAVIAPGGQAG